MGLAISIPNNNIHRSFFFFLDFFVYIAATVGFNTTILTEVEGGWDGVVELCAVLENLPSAGLGSQLILQLEKINIKSGNKNQVIRTK